MESSDDRVLFSIVFVLGAFIVLGMYDVLYWMSMRQPAPFSISLIGLSLISWGLRLIALIGCGILLARFASPGKRGLFLLLMGTALAYALTSSLLSDALYAGHMRQAFMEAVSRYQDQLKAGGSTLSLESFFPVVLLMNVVFRLLGLAIAALVSYFIASAVAGVMQKKPGPDGPAERAEGDQGPSDTPSAGT